MAAETEIQRLIVRLLGDSTMFQNMMREAAKAASDFERVRRNMAQAESSNEAIMRRGAEVAKSVQTATEAYSERVKELKMLLAKGAITQEVFNRAMRRARQILNEASSEVFKFGKRLTSIGSTTSILGGVLSLAFGSALTLATRAAGRFEQTTIAMNTMLGSAEETRKTLQRLTLFAAETPFEMPEILQAARMLIQFGERGDELMETLKMLGDAAAGTATPFGFLALVFNQIRGVGKLITQDFRQLASRGIISLQDLADHFKVPLKEAQRMLSEGKITFEDVRALFKELSSEGGRFANLMQKQSSSFLGSWSTLTDAVRIFLREIGETVTPTLTRLTQLLIRITDAMSGWSTGTKRAIGYTLLAGTALSSMLTVSSAVVTKVGLMVLVFDNFRRPIRAVIGSLGKLVTWLTTTKVTVAGLITSVKSATAALWGLIAANPVLAAVIAALTVAVVAVGYAFYESSRRVSKFAEEVKRAAGELKSQYEAQHQAAMSAVRAEENVGKALEDLKKRTNDLIEAREALSEPVTVEAVPRGIQRFLPFLGKWLAKREALKRQQVIEQENQKVIGQLNEEINKQLMEQGRLMEKLADPRRAAERVKEIEDIIAGLQQQRSEIVKALPWYKRWGAVLRAARAEAELGEIDERLAILKGRLQEAKRVQDEYNATLMPYQKMLNRLKIQVQNYGKSQAEITLALIEQRLATEELTDAQRRALEEARDLFATNIKELKRLKEEAEMKRVRESARRYIRELEIERMELLGAAASAEWHRLEMRKFTTEEIKYIMELRAANEATRQKIRLQQQAAREMERIASPTEKYRKRLKELKKMLDLPTKGLTLEAFDKLVKEADDELRKVLEQKYKVDVEVEVHGIEAIEAGTAEAAARIQEQMALAQRIAEEGATARRIDEEIEAIKREVLAPGGPVKELPAEATPLEPSKVMLAADSKRDLEDIKEATTKTADLLETAIDKGLTFVASSMS